MRIPEQLRVDYKILGILEDNIHLDALNWLAHPVIGVFSNHYADHSA